MKTLLGRASGGPRLLIAALMLLTILLPLSVTTRAAGPPLYPDLYSTEPSGLRLVRESVDGQLRYLLRFDNIVANDGGRLEIAANLAVSRNIYQNVYDQLVGGVRVEQHLAGSDLIFHPQHNHFHFEDFAAYSVFKKNSTGHYLATQYRGQKTSFCIIDYVRISGSGTTSPEYTFCNDRIQGLSHGWGDLYHSALPDQWVDFGVTVPPDGDYMLTSEANPSRKLKETNYTNNTGVTYFSIVNGQLASASQTPACTATPDSAQVGQTVQVSCTRLDPGTVVDLRWGSNVGPLLATATATSERKALASVTIPPDLMGAHPIFAVVQGTGVFFPANVNIVPSITVQPTSASIGSQVLVAGTGFASNEQISVRFNGVQIATAQSNIDGLVSAAVTLTDAPFGNRTVSLLGITSGGNPSTTINVQPRMDLTPGHTYAGEPVGVVLRGFPASSSVSLFIQGGSSLTTLQTNAQGSVPAAAGAQITIPTGTAPAQLTISAQSGGASASAGLLLLADGANTPTATATATNTPSPTATRTPTNSPTPSRTPSPSATATLPPTILDVGDIVQTTDLLNLRTGPGTSYGVREQLPPGTRLIVTGLGEASGEYLFIPVRKQTGGTTGWVAAEYVVRIGSVSTSTPTRTPTTTRTPGPPTATSTRTPSGTAFPMTDPRQTTANLNLRSNPTTSSDVLTVLSNGTTVYVTGPGQAGGIYFWLPVATTDGYAGWVASQYLTSPTQSPTATGTPTRTPTAVAPSPTSTPTRTPTTGPSSTATRTATTQPSSTPGSGGTLYRTTANLNLRFGAGLNYGVVRVLSNGEQVTVTGPGQNADGYVWLPVRTSTNQTGYAVSLYMQPVSGGSTATPTRTPTSTGETWVVLERLNLRSAPGTTSTIIRTLDVGTELTITGSGLPANGYIFVPVRLTDGTTGWVANLYIARVDSAPQIAEEQQAPAQEPAVNSPATDGTPARLDDPVLRWLPELRIASEQSGVPASILAAIVALESGGDPNVVANNGSAGLMHVSVDEFASLGVDSTMWNDPATNLQAGATVLAGLEGATGSLDAAILAWFGEGCTPSGYCGAAYLSDVHSLATSYAPLIADPAASGLTPLPDDWMPPRLAPYATGLDARPFPALPVESIDEVDQPAEVPPTDTPLPPTEVSGEEGPETEASPEP